MSNESFTQRIAELEKRATAVVSAQEAERAAALKAEFRQLAADARAAANVANSDDEGRGDASGRPAWDPRSKPGVDEGEFQLGLKLSGITEDQYYEYRAQQHADDAEDIELGRLLADRERSALPDERFAELRDALVEEAYNALPPKPEDEEAAIRQAYTELQDRRALERDAKREESRRALEAELAEGGD